VRRAAALVGAVLALSSCGQGAERGVERETRRRRPPPTGCPDRYAAADPEPWVPAPPTSETQGRLVPDADPVEALVCRYGDVSGAESAALAGGVQLGSGLDRMRTDLLLPARVEGAQVACTQIGGAVVPHLVRLRYADGELWLSARQEPNGCTDSGNGEFVTSTYLGDRLAEAYDTGGLARTRPGPVRRGQAGPCGSGGSAGAGGLDLAGGLHRGRQPPGGGPRPGRPGRLAARPARHAARTNACEGTPTSVPVGFLHAEGPPVLVSGRPAASPRSGNGSLSALPTPAQTELLGVLLG
jgi:hypothetical protein